jgi:hypothetical protein
MDVLSLCAFRTSQLLWRRPDGAWILTAICRGSFDLVPGIATLADDQEDPTDGDNHWSDDVNRSVYAPNDHVPYKRAADVVLVGNAYAPGGEPVRSLVARMSVGRIDKSVDVLADRALSPSGKIIEGAWFTRMPLRYERAAGGSRSSNPVGIDPETGRDAFGNTPLPNLVAKSGCEPAGFGPLAAPWLASEGGPAPNIAPRDQQLDVISEQERILLEHLHPTHARLETRLPGLRPRAVVTVDGRLNDLAMTCDTLWIDTDRARCTLTWRGSVVVSGPDAPGRVLIALESCERPLAREEVLRQRKPVRNATVVNEVAHVSRVLPFVVNGGPPPPVDASPTYDEPVRANLPGPSWLQAVPHAVAEPRPAPPVTVAHAASAAFAGAVAASNAASNDAPPPRKSDVVPRSDAQVTTDRVELITFERGAGARARKAPAFRAAFERAARGAWSSEALPAEDEAARDRREVVRAITRVDGHDEATLMNAFDASFGEGDREPPFVPVSGELSLSFDELETLKAMVAAAMPLSGSDKRVREAVDAGAAIARYDWRAPGEVLEAHTTAIRSALAQSQRSAEATYLQSVVERHLMEQRSFRARTVLGRKRLRATLTLPGARNAIPAYLPEAWGVELPGFARFSVRLLAELRPAQDPNEPHALALVVHALGRVISKAR